MPRRIIPSLKRKSPWCSLTKEVACGLPPPLPPLFGAASDEAEEPVNLEDGDDHWGKRLTNKKKRPQEKEAEKEADREFQEQLERMLAGEAKEAKEEDPKEEKVAYDVKNGELSDFDYWENRSLKG